MSSGHLGEKILNVQIRWLIRRDMPAVMEIENSSFDQPWDEDVFLECLKQRNCIGMVAEHNQRIVGFMIYELHKSLLHVLNFAVAPDCRRMRVGTQMVEKLIDKLSQQRRREIVLEVRETNLAAQLFFRAADFKAIRVIRDFYEDTEEDAYVMRYSLRSADLPATIPFPSNRISGLDAA